jgi:hypothetical protein
MNFKNSFMLLSSAQIGSFGTFCQSDVKRPVDASRPAGFNVASIWLDAVITILSGFQLISCALRMACAVNFGVDAKNTVSGPELASLTSSDSIVG